MSSVSPTTAPLPTPAATTPQAAAVAPGAAAPAAQTGTAAPTQAQQGAQQAQPRAEPFQARMLRLPSEPSTHDVLTALNAEVADPDTNATTREVLQGLYGQVWEAQKAMTQTMLDLMAAT